MFFSMFAFRPIVLCGCQSLVNLKSFSRRIFSSSARTCDYNEYRSVIFNNKLIDLPIRPKKPKAAFMNYRDSIMSDLKKQHPGITYKNLLRILGENWKKLDSDTKQSYINPVKKQNEEYLRQISVYRSSLSEEQKLALKDHLLRKKRRWTRTSFRKLTKILGKPKQPVNPFALFVEEKSREPSPIPFKERKKQWMIEWRNKPLFLKEKYKLQYTENRKKYRNDLEKWKESIAHLDQSVSTQESKVMKTLKQVLEDTLHLNINVGPQGEDEKLMRSLKEKLIRGSRNFEDLFYRTTAERNENRRN